jgi:hypothetical protein
VRAAYVAVTLGAVAVLVGAYLITPGLALLIGGVGVAGWGLLVERAPGVGR